MRGEARSQLRVPRRRFATVLRLGDPLWGPLLREDSLSDTMRVEFQVTVDFKSFVEKGLFSPGISRTFL